MSTVKSFERRIGRKLKDREAGVLRELIEQSMRDAFDAGVDHGMGATNLSNKDAYDEWAGWGK